MDHRQGSAFSSRSNQSHSSSLATSPSASQTTYSTSPMTEQLELESLQSGTEGADEYEEDENPVTNAGRPAVRIARYSREPLVPAASHVTDPGPSHNYLAPPPLRYKRRKTGPLDGSERDKKRRKIPLEHDGPVYGCPYRIKNPARFTVHTHSGCALQPYTDFSMLKRHVRNYHRRATAQIVCPRCHQPFEDDSEVQKHIQVGPKELCPIVPAVTNVDMEDGISAETSDMLKERKNGCKIDSWSALWRVLFPGDEKIPPGDFQPVVDVKEVQSDLTSLMAELLAVLSTDYIHFGFPDSPQSRQKTMARHSDIWTSILRVDAVFPMLPAVPRGALAVADSVSTPGIIVERASSTDQHRAQVLERLRMWLPDLYLLDPIQPPSTPGTGPLFEDAEQSAGAALHLGDELLDTATQRPSSAPPDLAIDLNLPALPQPAAR